MKEIKRRDVLKRAGLGAAALAAGGLMAGNSFAQRPPSKSKRSDVYEIGVYYFPNYHVDPRNEAVHGKGWTEWELVKKAVPKYPGHGQPKIPLWGYEDESNPRAFEKKINAAADHGIDFFIFDWYWYNDGSFLLRCLENGYLNSANNDRLKFALMLANHDWVDIHPAKMHNDPKLLYPGALSNETFDKMTDYIIEKYFLHSSYYTIDGRPYFSFFRLDMLIDGLGGIEKTQEALEAFRAKTKTAGFPDLHLNAITSGIRLPGGIKEKMDQNEILSALNFDSVTPYVWASLVNKGEFPKTDYRFVVKQAVESWRQMNEKFSVPYYPNVSMGWDASPRTCHTDIFTRVGYPYMPIVDGNTPDEFKKALQKVKDFLDARGNPAKIFTLNAWNEWTEGSYLEPDTTYGMGYLKAIREVFGF